MKLEAGVIQNIYEGKVAKRYDMSMSHFFARFKQAAFNESSMKKGYTVLVFCCGTGLDFPFILKKIGKEGNIIGVDFSVEMLRIAQKRIKKNNWENVELIYDDVTKYKERLIRKADIGVCTLGLSIIPDYKSAYYNLLSNVKSQGEIIIGDMQLASGRLAHLNPLTLSMAKRYGGTEEGYSNSLELQSLMRSELDDVKNKEYFFNAYYYCVGKKKGT